MPPLRIFISLLFCFLATFSSAQIAHYKFDNNAEDASLGNNSGKIYGGVTSAKNRFGVECTAYKFDGQTGYIKIANNSALKKIKGKLSIAVWAKLSSASPNTWFTICCKSNTAEEFFDNPHYRFQLSNNQVSLSTEATSQWKKTFQKNKWYFLVITVSNTNKKVYIDGQLALNKILDGPLEKNNQPLLIGRDMPGQDEFFNGTMDDLRIYNRVLTSSEIAHLYTDNSEQNMQSPCFNPTDTIQVSVECGDVVKAGGNEISIKKMNLGQENGKFILSYNMYKVPDKMTITSAATGEILFATKNFVSGKKVKTIRYKGTQHIIIKVEGNTKKGTKWNYNIKCQ